jgi:hypothetical protein
MTPPEKNVVRRAGKPTPHERGCHLIQTAKMNGVNPIGFLANVLERVVAGRTKQNELHTPLLWSWTWSIIPRCYMM